MKPEQVFLTKLTAENIGIYWYQDAYFAIGEEVHSRWYGMELESAFDVSPALIRAVYLLLLQRYAWKAGTEKDIFNFVVKHLGTHLKFLMKVEDDADFNMELVTYPSSGLALEKQVTQMCYALEKAKLFGFDCSHPQAGVHLNVNSINFGRTWPERLETMKKFLYFCFFNRDFINKVSRRKGRAQKHSDIQFQLDDFLGAKTPEELYEKFCLTLDYAMNCWKNGQEAKAMNVIFRKDRVEIRWFGSSDNPSVLMSYQQLVDSLIFFVDRQDVINDDSLDNYLEFVAAFEDEYGHLATQLGEL